MSSVQTTFGDATSIEAIAWKCWSLHECLPVSYSRVYSRAYTHTHTHTRIHAGIPITVCVAAHRDHCYKPGIGMWDVFTSKLNGGVDVDKTMSFYV